MFVVYSFVVSSVDFISKDCIDGDVSGRLKDGTYKISLSD